MFLLVFIGYFLLLLGVSWWVGRSSGHADTTWYLADRRSPWWLVAVGMIGSSLSGVSFVSVPGMVATGGYNYLYMVVGFVFGYVVIARVLLPLYYKKGLTSIYSYLGDRFGRVTHKTGALFFILSKLLGAAISLYAVAMILQLLVFSNYGVPFWFTAVVLMGMIWLYTYRSGVKSILWTDLVQTVCMLLALLGLVGVLYVRLRTSDALPPLRLYHQPMPWHRALLSFLSGVFIPIVMTGLDQDKMQKNLTCRTLADAQKNMYWYGLAFVPVNMLFLLLGALMLRYVDVSGLASAVVGLTPDQLLPYLATNAFGTTVAVLFAIGLTAAAFSSADSALAALTTSYCVDVNPRSSRRWVHLLMTGLMAVLMVLIDKVNDRSLLDAVYTVVSYTYGPLLGLFCWGLFCERRVADRWVPIGAVAAPLLCYLLDRCSLYLWGYRFGYELLLVNAAIMMGWLWLISSSRYNSLKKV